jgi:hypothetical protein
MFQPRRAGADHLSPAAGAPLAAATVCRALLLILLTVCVDTVSRAQCDSWRAGPLPTTVGSAFSSVLWDPDGTGPAQPLLVIGGLFNRVGGAAGQTTSNIAAWNGSSWQLIGPGTGDGAVQALTVFNGQLIAGGTFSNFRNGFTGPAARWTGSSWVGLGSGFDEHVYALTVFGGELIAGGTFTTAGGVSANRIAAWNGTSWRSLGAGVTDGPSASVYSLGVFGSQLIAAGNFGNIGGVAANHIARWNGTSWSALGPGVGTVGVTSQYVYALTTFQGELIAAGLFDGAGGGPARNIARWNGSSWRQLGTGIEDGVVTCLNTFGVELVAGGLLHTAGGTAVVGVARWNGTRWAGIGAPAPEFGYRFDPTIYVLANYNNQLIIGGQFTRAGTLTVDSMVMWNSAFFTDMPGLSFQPQGIPYVQAMATWNGFIVAGGSFFASMLPTGIATTHLAAWNGTDATPVFNASPDGTVEALLSVNRPIGHSSDLYVGGNFTHMEPGGPLINRIARINSLVANGWEALGSGLNGAVFAIENHAGSIYAAGEFTASGSTAVSRIARWNGSAWEPLGAGANNTIYALKSFAGQLYAGGPFTSVGGVSTGGLARWNATTSTWQSVGGFFGGTVNALDIFNSQLVIGGQFPGINSSPNIAFYNGSSYSTPGTGGADQPIYNLGVSSNTLVVGGSFSSVGGAPAAHIARWDGSHWAGIRGGTDDAVYALQSFNGELHVGGQFGHLSGFGTESPFWARFLETGAPWLNRQPFSQSICRAQTATFSVRAATGPDFPTYTWRLSTVPVTLGPTGSGSVRTSDGPSLTITNAGPADAGSYDCVVANDCGSVTSIAATLSVCAADMNCDGQINVADYLAFLARYSAGDQSAEFTGDGRIDIADYLAFLSAFAAGC